jgi:hypothetical protein
MKKQTAVEWLVKQIENNVHHTIRIPRDYFDQAKEMEREQINDAFESGYVAGDIDDGKNGLEYYTETYKGGEQ